MSPEPEAMASEATGGAGLRRVAGIAAGLVLVALLLVFGRRLATYLPAFASWVESQGALGPIVFVAGYAVAVVDFVPGSVLTLAGGALFGVARGIVYVFGAAVLGSTLSFLLARHVARSAV
ncbi:TVP38/TMEM64 family protein, partial [Myxococcota bacterium]|nr:TVP38/TMEM64 family protein [Myxococcota bacterium]